MKKLFLATVLAMASAATWGQSANTVAIPLASALQTSASVVSSDLSNYWYRGAHIIVNVSAYTSGNYTVHVQGKDPASGAYYDILVGPAIAASGILILKVYPGIVVSANATASDVLPQVWRVTLVGASTPSMTMSVSAFLEL